MRPSISGSVGRNGKPGSVPGYGQIFRRGEDGWLHEIILPGETLPVRSLDLRLNMDDIYETADVPRTAEKEDC